MDLRAATKALRRAPGFSFFAVITLALGIGAATSVFSVLERILLRPLPYPESERLVLLGVEAGRDSGRILPLSTALMDRFQEDPGPAEVVVSGWGTTLLLRDRGEPERMEAARVTRGFFGLLGAEAAVGRLLVASDFEADAPKVVVLGHRLWTTRYGADPGAVGMSVRLNDEVYTVVGVLADGFVPPPDVTGARDVWVPLDAAAERERGGSFYLRAIARLRPGTTPAELDAYADRMVEDVYAGTPEASMLSGGITGSYKNRVVGPIAGTLRRVMAAVLLLLLISCVNVAGLMLTRGTQRARELAVRAALGAGRMRLVRQMVAEGVLVAVGAGVIGGGLAWGAVELFRTHAPAGLPRLQEVAVDARGLGFAVALGLGTVLLFGLLPALRNSARAEPGTAGLSRRATASRGDGRLQSGLVTVETALAVVLSVASMLLARDLATIAAEEPGFHPPGLVAMQLDLRPRFGPDEYLAVWEQLLDGAERLPGATHVGLATQAPFTGPRIAALYLPEGTEESEGDMVIQVMVGGEYVEALGARIVEGRALDSSDDGVAPVVLVNAALAEKYWPGESALGKRLLRIIGGAVDGPPLEVVGVLDDIRSRVGEEVEPHIFTPMQVTPWSPMEVLVRTEGEPAALAPPLRDLVHRLDPTLAISRIAPVEMLAREGLSRPAFYATLFGGSAVVAVLLAVVGVFGTTSYATRGRTREIGIRMALGARRERVVGAVVARAAIVVALGVTMGLLAAAWGAQVMDGLLVHVAPRDGLAYASVALLMLGAGALAALYPASRAGRVDPASTLREEA